MSGVLRVRWLWSGVVEDIPADDVVTCPARCGQRLVYTNADGQPGCISEDVKRPGGVFVRGEFGGSAVCLDLHDERDTRWLEDVAGCLVEVAGRLGGWDGDDQVCAVVTRPGVEPVLEGGGDAGAPVGGFYGEVVDHGYVVEDRVSVVVEAVSFKPLGFLLVGADEGGPYEITVAPSSYQFPVQVVVPAGDGFWERNVAWFGDLLGDECPDCLYFFFRRGWVDVEVFSSRSGAGGRRGRLSGGSAEDASDGLGDGAGQGHGNSSSSSVSAGTVQVSPERERWAS